MIAEALATLKALANDDRAAEAAAYHKAPRVYLGIPVPQITELANGWREQLSVEDRVALADALWQTPRSWRRSSLLNTARSGLFSSDRAIGEYAERVWGVKPLPVELACNLPTLN